MNSIDREKIMTRLEEQYAVADEYGYEAVGIFLYGSQNYGLDTAESDIDSKVIVIPKFTDFLHNKKPVSFTHVMENDEHIDFKDIRLMFQCYKKQNINFVETLFTEYFILNPEYEDLFSNVMDRREEIAQYDIKAALSCVMGMAYEKRKALCHPYPTTAWKIEKWGYDPKQLHHIIRLYEFICNYTGNLVIDGGFLHYEPRLYNQCLTLHKDIQKLKEIKNDPTFSVDEAVDLADEMVDKIKLIREHTMNDLALYQDDKIHDQAEYVLNIILERIIARSFKKEILNMPDVIE